MTVTPIHSSANWQIKVIITIIIIKKSKDGESQNALDFGNC